MINDYPELIAEVIARTGLEGVPERAAMYVGMAEKLLQKSLRVPGMEGEATITTDANGVAALPSDFLGMRYVSVAGKKLPKLAFGVVDRASRTGYAIQGGNLKSTKKGADHECAYYKTLPSLVTNNTSWLLDEEPEMYVQAVLFQVQSGAGDLEKAKIAFEYLNHLITLANDIAKEHTYRGIRTTL